MAKHQFTRETLNATLAVATGFIFVKKNAGKTTLHSPDFCKLFNITDDRIKEMNRKLKEESKKHGCKNRTQKTKAQRKN
jgi:hypothetical protein